MQGVLGEIRLFTSNRVPENWLACNGQSLSVSENSELFALIGTRFGGDGISSFALPDLAPAQGPRFSGVSVGYIICVSGAWPLEGGLDGLVGEIILWPSARIPGGWELCQGQQLSVAAYQELFSVVGYRFLEAGSAFGLPNLPSLGQVHYLICTAGLYPTQGEDGSPGDYYIGEVSLFAGNFTPSGFTSLTNLVSYNIQNYSDIQAQILYSILGNEYGGFFPNFQLPQLAPISGGLGDVSYILASQGLYPELFS